VPEQYVHRIGRTARANRSGVAHAFVAKEERAYLKDIQKLLKTTIPVVELPEDFVQKARALKTRKPIVRPAQPKQEPRKGRGKSKKRKARFSKDREKKSRDSRKDHNKDDRGKASEKSRNPSNEKRENKPRDDKPGKAAENLATEKGLKTDLQNLKAIIKNSPLHVLKCKGLFLLAM